MAKRIRYSQPLAVIWDAYHETVRKNKCEVTPKQFIWEWMLPDIKNPFLTNEASFQVQTNILISDMFISDTEKKFLHLYFVDNSLRDFLIDLPLSDFDGLSEFICENGEEVGDSVISTTGQAFKTEKTSTHLEFGIHIPFENKYRGYAFSFTYKAKEKKLLFTWLVGDDSGYITEDIFSKLEKQNDERSKTVFAYLRLAVNTIAYMNTFPDCIKDGVPEENKEEYSKSVMVSEKVIEINEAVNSGNKITPHFRRGYFKRLTSDFYTHKKGQIVFVKKTMVNGKAKTVYTADNLEEMVD